MRGPGGTLQEVEGDLRPHTILVLGVEVDTHPRVPGGTLQELEEDLRPHTILVLGVEVDLKTPVSKS